MTRHYLACDLGAESGRLISGTLENAELSLQEIHRFANTPKRVDGSLLWSIPSLILELKEGLRKAAATGLKFESISTDSWGVDYILFRSSSALSASSALKKGAPSDQSLSEFEILEPIYHYRDPRTKHGVERAYTRTTWHEIFGETGIQFMPINTLFQLASEDPARLRSASFLLGVGDAFNYFLAGGAPKIEVSMASTFQLYNPRTRQWSDKLIDALGLPRSIFPEIVPSATRLGTLRPELASELNLASLEVIATCSHDTGAAVVGVPADLIGGTSSTRPTSTSRDARTNQGASPAGTNPKRNPVHPSHPENPVKNPSSSSSSSASSALTSPPPTWAYLSSGTWSLMGVELSEPIINDLARELNFTNEIGYGNSVRFLKNISGLWLIQECKRQWAREGRDFDYSTLTKLAEEAPPFFSLINPASEEFLAPENMVSQIVQFCRRTGQPAPKNEGAFVRCALESLALLYRRTLRQIEQLTNQKIDRLHIVGGGSNNDLLNQFTANATGIPILAGPAEATAAGNVILQALALGHIESLAAGREIIRGSSVLRVFEPQATDVWDRAFKKFETLLSPAQKPDGAQLISTPG